MPINNNTHIRTQTNIGGNVIDNEAWQQPRYSDNQQQTPVIRKTDKDMYVYGKPSQEFLDAQRAKEAPTDEKLEKAINNDLANRGLKKTPTKRTRKTTTKTTETK
tara:strand:- start:1372 stop:1686 length:315 start_codon:yes stop_codon:yes gene_type:complete